MDPKDCRLLCVTDRRFWRRSIGSEQRVASQLVHLARRGHPLVVAYPGRLGAEERREVEAFARALPDCVVRARRFGARDWIDLVGGRIASAGPDANPLLRARSPARRRFVSRVLQETAPRVVIVQMTRLTPLVHPRTPAAAGSVLHLLDAHDLLARRAARARAIGLAPDLDVSADQEREAFATYDAILAIQAVEAEAIRARLPDRPVLVVPHGLALPALPSGRPGRDERIRLGFLGGRDAANDDALHWFLDRVWPVLHEQVAGRVELVVGGRVCGGWTRIERGVRVVGAVASIDTFWPEIDVAINPVRFGSGLKIKNVEALAWARALVTSPIGAEGLEAAAPTGLCIAETPAQWHSTLLDLIERPERIDALGRAGRRHAERHFSERAAFAELDAFLDALPTGSPVVGRASGRSG
ncbi:MAG: glycosyltransferase [Myxococcota bacterium]